MLNPRHTPTPTTKMERQPAPPIESSVSTLPSLQSFGPVNDIQPVVLIDTREQTPLAFTRLASVEATLRTGDYSVRGCERLFAVERKTVADFVGCCMGDSRERFERELHRLQAFAFKRLLMVGDPTEIEEHQYHSKMAPKAVSASLRAFEVRYAVPVVWARTPEAAAILVEDWAWWFSRELLLSAKTIAGAMLPTSQEG